MNVTSYEKRRLFQEASKRYESGAGRKSEPIRAVHVRIVQQILFRNNNLQFKKTKTAPALRKLHRVQRVASAKKHLLWRQYDWFKVTFSNEKNYNLGGPNCFA